MSCKRRWLRILIIALTAVILMTSLLALRPRQWVVGGLVGGPIAPGATAYREEYACIGIKLIVPLNCVDCGPSNPCFGIVTGKTCSIEKYDPLLGIVRTPVACSDGDQPAPHP